MSITLFAGLIDTSEPSEILVLQNTYDVPITTGEAVGGATGHNPPTYNGCCSLERAFSRGNTLGVACSNIASEIKPNYEQYEYLPVLISGFVWVKTDGGSMNGQIYFNFDTKLFTTSTVDPYYIVTVSNVIPTSKTIVGSDNLVRLRFIGNQHK